MPQRLKEKGIKYHKGGSKKRQAGGMAPEMRAAMAAKETAAEAAGARAPQMMGAKEKMMGAAGPAMSGREGAPHPAAMSGAAGMGMVPGVGSMMNPAGKMAGKPGAAMPAGIPIPIAPISEPINFIVDLNGNL